MKSTNRFEGFWPGFMPSSPGGEFLFGSIKSKIIGSVFSAGDKYDVLFSGEGVNAYKVDDVFLIERSGARFEAPFFIGIPLIEDRCALHCPLFYLYWAEMNAAGQHPPSSLCREFGVSAVVSNGWCGGLAARRVRFIHELSLYVPVHVNAAQREFAPSWSRVHFHQVPDKHEFLSRYTHNICFENAKIPGYLTEKLFHSCWSGCIPLYDGDPLFGRWFDADCVINCENLGALEVADSIFNSGYAELGRYIDSRRTGICAVGLEEMSSLISDFCKKVIDS